WSHNQLELNLVDTELVVNE
ncbi:UDP-D-quinovosamine 4-dehydrogenase, partial [Vibrio parahaemolyticus VP2007-007]